jgi:sentrin-specific protease 1
MANDEVISVPALEGRRYRNIPIFKDVSRDLRQRIAAALHANRADEIVVDAGEGCTVTGRSLTRVAWSTWLNDEAINAWMQYLWEGAKGNDSVYGGGGFVRQSGNPRPFQPMSTYFWTYLQDPEKYPRLKKICLKRDIHDTTIKGVHTLCIPVNLRGNHWALGVVFPQTREIEFYDSLGMNESDVEDFADKFLGWWGRFALEWAEEAGEFQFLTADRSDWQVRHMGATQREGHECGVYVCWNAYCMARYITGDKLEGMDVPAARREIAAILLNGGFRGEYAFTQRLAQ